MAGGLGGKFLGRGQWRQRKHRLCLGDRRLVSILYPFDGDLFVLFLFPSFELHLVRFWIEACVLVCVLQLWMGGRPLDIGKQQGENWHFLGSTYHILICNRRHHHTATGRTACYVQVSIFSTCSCMRTWQLLPNTARTWYYLYCRMAVNAASFRRAEPGVPSGNKTT